MRPFDIATGILVTSLAAVSLHSPAPVAAEGVTSHRRVRAVARASYPGGRVVREVDVVAERFEFRPDRLVVDQGDHVRVTIRSADGTHGFEIRGLGIRAKVPRGGEPVTVEFDADRAGTFEIRCFEYCGTGHRQMRAELVVVPASGGER